MGDDLSGPATSKLGPNAGGRIWLAIVLTGLGTGACAAALTLVLQAVQHFVWPGPTLLDAAAQAMPWRHILVLLGAGLVTGAGQIVLVRLTSGNSIDITEAIWFSAGRLPAWRTLGSAVLSVIVVGMGASLGREGAPKQAGAVIANALSDKAGLSDEQRRLLVACGAGAGMAAAYGVPLGGALFALEVLRGMLALRLVLPALLTSVIAAATAWLVLPNVPTYAIPRFDNFTANLALAVLIGPIAGLVSVGFVRVIARADRNRPKHWRRLVAPLFGARTARGGVDFVSAIAWKRQGHRPTRLHGRASVRASAGASGSQARCDGVVPGKRRAGRLVYPLAGTWSAAWRGSRSRVLPVLARGAACAGRGRRCRRCSGGDHARTDLGGRFDHGIDRSGPVVHSAAIGCGDHCNAGFASDRTALDL